MPYDLYNNIIVLTEIYAYILIIHFCPWHMRYYGYFNSEVIFAKWKSPSTLFQILDGKDLYLYVS